MPLATTRYLRDIANLTSGNRQMYRDACRDAADEIERLQNTLALTLPFITFEAVKPKDDLERKIAQEVRRKVQAALGHQSLAKEPNK